MTEQVIERTAQHLVTSENLTAFNADRLRLDKPEVKEAPKEEIKAEVKTEEPIKEEVKEPPVEPKKEPKKTGFSERLSELATQRKTAEERAAKEAERAAAAEKERDELKAKLAPPQEKIDPTARPKLADFNNDADKWGEALLEWNNREQKRLEAEKQQKDWVENRQKTFAERIQKAQEELPDIFDKINSRKEVQITNIMEDAIFEAGEDGPRVLYHLADHLEEIQRISKLSPASQVREIDKIASTLRPKKEVTEPKEEPKLQAVPSKAPAPITPVKAVAGSEVANKIDAKGEFTGTPAEWKALRKAGKIS